MKTRRIFDFLLKCMSTDFRFSVQISIFIFFLTIYRFSEKCRPIFRQNYIFSISDKCRYSVRFGLNIDFLSNFTQFQIFNERRILEKSCTLSFITDCQSLVYKSNHSIQKCLYYAFNFHLSINRQMSTNFRFYENVCLCFASNAEKISILCEMSINFRFSVNSRSIFGFP